MRRRKFLKQIGLITGGIISAPIFFRQYEAKAITQPKNKPVPENWKSSDISIAWIGHSTVLINLFGTVILTDPVLFQRIGINILGMTYGPGRHSYPALKIEELPKPDFILLSHGHMDHTDYNTLSAITEKFPKQIDCITAYNTKDIVSDLKWKTIQELDWNESGICNDVKISTLEVKHFGWRYPWERDRSKGFFKNGRSFNAYILEKNGKKILFGGDTALTNKFKTNGSEGVDIAIMPIGAYNPWHSVHCNPEEALAMAKDAGAKIFIPIHCNTFKQSFEPMDEPIKRLLKAIPDSGCALGLGDIGETFVYKG